jgi:anti-repressor protein
MIPDPGRASKAVELVVQGATGWGHSPDPLSFTFGDDELRAVMIDNDPWFVLSDICRNLEIGNVGNVAERLNRSGAGIRQTDIRSGGQMRMVTIVDESGMYEAVIRSDKPEALKFRRWVTGEVLPAIRRSGTYSTTPALTGAELFAHAVIEAQAMLAAKDEQIAELTPKAELADQFLNTDGDLSVGDAAQVLTRAGIKTGRGRLFATLEGKTWIYRARGDGRYRVCQRAIDAGWMSVLPQSHYHPKSGELVLDPPQPRVTPKGLQRLLVDLGAHA